MKKITSIIVALCMLFAMTVTANALSGKGTAANPFRISTADELLLLADFPDAYFELENDIELTEAWTPVPDFSGNLNGKGHSITISSFKLYANTGLFSVLSGKVENLTFVANEVKIDSYTLRASVNAGLIAGTCSGTVEKCRASGKITLDPYYNYPIFFGGICGILTGSINQCVSNFEIIKLADYYAYYGGIASKVEPTGTITDSMNYDLSITSDSSNNYYGGIAYNNAGEISNCYSVGGNGLSTNYEYGVSKLSGDGVMNSCFYDKNVFGYTGTATTYGIPKSTIAMKMEMTYTDWDFENVWAIDESEENPINNGYPYLKALYPDHREPVTVSDVSVSGGNIIVDTKITDTSESYVLHVAMFNNNNKLCQYIVIPNERCLKDVFAVVPDNSEISYVKIFTWSGLNQIEPIAQNETIQIVR